MAELVLLSLVLEAQKGDASIQVCMSSRPGHRRRFLSRALLAMSPFPLMLFTISIPMTVFISWLILVIPAGSAYNEEEMVAQCLEAH